jgi:hypothetical protein
MMRAAALTAVAALSAGGGLSVAVLGGGARAQVPDPPPATTVALGAGDAMVVEGAPIGCQVIRRGGRLVIDCRRAGPLRGTYGTLISARRAEIARFRSNRSAKVIFTARHHGGAHRCR